MHLMIGTLALLQGCASQALRNDTSPLPNLGEIKAKAHAYHDSGQYERDISAVIDNAAKYLHAHLKGVAKPAIVLDVDETSITNWEQLTANDFGYFTNGSCDLLPKGPCGALAWDALARAPAIAPTLRLFNTARDDGVAIFFVTGRYEKEKDATERTLSKAGYANWSGLYMRTEAKGTTAEYKTAQRVAIEAQGFTILANVGDQPSDLAGGHAQQGFLLPNPFYRIP